MSRIGSVLTGDRSDCGDGPPVHALLIQNQNPLTVCPDSNRVRRGFARDDLFVCVHEQFMTETARWPTSCCRRRCSWSTTTSTRPAATRIIQIGPKLIEPPGECRSNHEVLQGLAPRLGAKHRGFEMTAMEIIDATLRASGWPDAATVLRERWIDAMPAVRRRRISSTGFPQPDKRFHFAPDWASARATNHAVHAEAAGPHGDHRRRRRRTQPFRLVTAPARSFLNTSFTEMPIRGGARAGRPCWCIRTMRRGWASPTATRCGSATRAARSCCTRASPTGCSRACWCRKASGRARRFEGGIGINALTSDDPGPPGGGAVFHDTAVWLRAEAAELALAAE